MRARANAAVATTKAPAPLFAALGDATRLHLVSRLSHEGPLSITRLTAGTRVTRQAVTKHLRVMEHAGLVRVSHLGRERIWRLELQRFVDALHYLEIISKQWDAALDRLRRFVES